MLGRLTDEPAQPEPREKSTSDTCDCWREGALIGAELAFGLAPTELERPKVNLRACSSTWTWSSGIGAAIVSWAAVGNGQGTWDGVNERRSATRRVGVGGGMDAKRTGSDDGESGDGSELHFDYRKEKKDVGVVVVV